MTYTKPTGAQSASTGTQAESMARTTRDALRERVDRLNRRVRARRVRARGGERAMTDQMITRAEELGTEAGKAAAQWVFGDRTTEDTYRRYAEGIAEGDPEIMDSLREPSLSGEYADDYRSSDLLFDLGADGAEETEYQDELCRAWEESASASFWAEVERIARQHNPEEIVTRRRDGITYLLADGNLRVPCSRYGRDTEACAPVAWRLAFLVAREQGEAIRHRDLDWAMGLVVNDHDDVAYIVREYGHRDYGR